MFVTIETHEQPENLDLIDRMYRLRAKVFGSELGWDVSVVNGREADYYDRCNPVYLIWTDAGKRELYGSVRLLPTTGPTLLYDVFHDTFPGELSLSAPGIWEGTRLCVNEDAFAHRMPQVGKKTAFCLMLLALCETALKNHIHTLISNFEPPTRRLYRAAGAPLQELGSSDGYGRRPVCAGLFPVDKRTLDQMRSAIGVESTLLVADINDRLRSVMRAAA